MYRAGQLITIPVWTIYDGYHVRLEFPVFRITKVKKDNICKGCEFEGDACKRFPFKCYPCEECHFRRALYNRFSPCPKYCSKEKDNKKIPIDCCFKKV